MRVLIVSFFHLNQLNSSSQNNFFLSRELLERQHKVKLVSSDRDRENKRDEGKRLITTLPISSTSHEVKWLTFWRPNRYSQTIASNILREWPPDVLYMGAWKGFAGFVFAARELGIPVIQMVHDYSILCLRHWLVDSRGQVCRGPELARCKACIRHGLGWKDRIKDAVLSLPFLGDALWPRVEKSARWGIHVDRVVDEAYAHMQRYRESIDLFIAQSPSVVAYLEAAGVDPDRCRFLPQYIGEEKLRRYPRPEGKPGVDRPLRFVYVGRWSREKGADILLDAYLSAQLPLPTALWVITRSATAEKISSQAGHQLRSGKALRVFNNLQGGGVSLKLAQADVCIVPSLNPETGSRAVLEAHAQGVPVVASSVVGNRYVIEDGVNGRIFPAGNVKALQECIEEIAREPSMLTRWAARIKTPIDKETWTRRVMEIFQEALARGIET